MPNFQSAVDAINKEEDRQIQTDRQTDRQTGEHLTSHLSDRPVPWV